MIFLGVLLAITIAAVLYLVSLYNSLVTSRNQYKNAFSQIDVQLTRRYDLIPNLIAVAKKYMSHERETLEAVINARNTAKAALQTARANPTDNEAIKGLAAAETALGGAMGGFFAVSEAYPDLKANENMIQLSEEITSTENRIAFSRQNYNDCVTTYNNNTEMFPSSFIAQRYGFKIAQLLEIDGIETKRENIKVDFD